MFRSHQFIAAGFAIAALASISKTVTAATTPEEEASPVVSFESAIGGETVEITRIADLQPFTHVAYIPVGADLSSIKLKQIKAVSVATKRRLATNLHYCEERLRAEPGGSMYCPLTTDESTVSAYKLTYAFTAPPLASDEYGNTSFTFSVYFRPDELGPRLRQVLALASRSLPALRS